MGYLDIEQRQYIAPQDAAGGAQQIIYTISTGMMLLMRKYECGAEGWELWVRETGGEGVGGWRVFRIESIYM